VDKVRWKDIRKLIRQESQYFKKKVVCNELFLQRSNIFVY